MAVSAGRRPLGAMAGLLAGLAALAAAELVAAFVRPEASPVVAVGGAVIDAAPRPLKDYAIETFGTNDKPVLVGSILVLLVLIALGTGAIAASRPAVGLVGVAVLGFVGAVAAASRPEAGGLDPLPSVLGALLGAWVLLRLLRPLRPAYEGTPDQGRRQFVVTALWVGAGSLASAVIGRTLAGRRTDVTASRNAVHLPPPAAPASPLPAGSDLGIKNLSPFTTPNDDFYRVDTALIVPRISTDDWRLRVHGMVDREIELGFRQLLARDLVERDITLACVSNPVGGPYVGNARWLGVPLADLLREVGVAPGADMLLSRSDDGLTIGTPTAVVMDGRDALLAVGMNGEPLPLEHGFPVRMVVPGLYGYVSACKWLVEIEATTFEAQTPYWVERGWAQRAPVKTMSRIDTPRPFAQVKAGRVAVAGVAWAQHRGISKVEVRMDGGAWQEARLADEPSVDTWRQWVWQWDAPAGSHTLEVRATDGTGATQPSRHTEPFPSGATGWSSTEVHVV